MQCATMADYNAIALLNYYILNCDEHCYSLEDIISSFYHTYVIVLVETYVIVFGTTDIRHGLNVVAIYKRRSLSRKKLIYCNQI